MLALQPSQCCLDRGAPTLEIHRPGQDRPRAHERVEPGDRVAVALDQPRIAVLVPHAVEAKAYLFGALAVRSCASVALADLGEVGEVDQRVVEKEAEPDALARAAVAEIAEAVVPVAAAD